MFVVAVIYLTAWLVGASLSGVVFCAEDELSPSKRKLARAALAALISPVCLLWLYIKDLRRTLKQTEEADNG